MNAAKARSAPASDIDNSQTVGTPMSSNGSTIRSGDNIDMIHVPMRSDTVAAPRTGHLPTVRKAVVVPVPGTVGLVVPFLDEHGGGGRVRAGDPSRRDSVLVDVRERARARARVLAAILYTLAGVMKDLSPLLPFPLPSSCWTSRRGHFPPT